MDLSGCWTKKRDLMLTMVEEEDLAKRLMERMMALAVDRRRLVLARRWRDLRELEKRKWQVRRGRGRK